LAVADPVFGAEDERVQRGDVTLAALPGDERVNTRREIAATVSEHVGEAVFLPLPSTSKMADDLKTIWKEVTVLSGLEASESRIKQTNLSRFGEVVFATHGIIDSRTPYLLEPALVLSSPDYTGEEGEDGYLTASEIMNLTFQTDTVAALACVTGLGKVVGGEGVMHLGRAFQYAGAKSALISLWSVEDESTNHLALTFFSALKQGKGKDQALLEARKSLMNQGYRHPFFWSSFILYGEER